MVEPKEFVNYNNKDYFFIAKNNIDGKDIYHYLCEDMIDYIIDDEKYESIDEDNPPIFSMFMTSENGQYAIVENKKLIKKYIREFGMDPEPIAYSVFWKAYLILLAGSLGMRLAEYRPYILDVNKKQDFKEKQKEAFKDLKEKLNVDIDLDRIDKKIDKLHISGYKNEEVRVNGFYNILTNGIFIKNSVFKNEDEYKKVGLHETVHYLGGRGVLKKNKFARALMEGQTENVVVDYFDEGKSSEQKFYCENNEEIKKACIQYNFVTSSSYSPFVSTVKQLEYIIGEKSHKSIINGDRDFIKKVEKEIGKRDLLKIIGKSSYMYYLTCTDLGRFLDGDRLELEKSIQDLILKSYFGKKFDEINTVEDAKEYMEKLRGFETYRAKITCLTKDNEIVKDDTYKEFYEEKYNNLVERFGDNKEFVEDYKYKEQEYRELKMKDEEEFKKECKRALYFANKEGIDEPQNFEIDVYRTKNGGRIFCYGEKEFIPFSFPGEEDLLYSKIQFENPEMKFKERNKLFLEQVGDGKEKLNIEFTEDDIKEFEELRKKVKKPGALVKVEKKIAKGMFIFREKAEKRRNGEILDKDKNKNKKETKDYGNSDFLNKWSFDNLSKEKQSEFLKKQADKIKNINEKRKKNFGKQKNIDDTKNDINDINKLDFK